MSSILVSSRLTACPGSLRTGLARVAFSNAASGNYRIAAAQALPLSSSSSSSAPRSGAIATPRFLFTTPARLQQAAEALAEVIQPPPTATKASEQQNGEEGAAPRRAEKDSTFASMKGHISYPTWKALTVKPFAYTEMSPVQQRVLHLLPELADAQVEMADGQGRDMLVKAKTGTGKTIAFLVPAIEARLHALHQVERGLFSKPWAEVLARNKPDLKFDELDKHGRQALRRQFAENSVGTLVLSPTRELATQIANEAIKLHHHHEKMEVQLLVGGASRSRQMNDWRRGRPDVVVATPGRILDLLRDCSFIREAMNSTQTLILDEADTLLEMGFRDDLRAILDFLPKERQTMLFSATVSKDIKDIARQSLNKRHRFIDCVPAGEENVHRHIPQFATVLENSGDQIAHAVRLVAQDQLLNPGKSKVIIFAPTTKMTQFLSEVFHSVRRSLPLGAGGHIYEIHSKKDQSQRFRTSDRFRKDACGGSILITSDVSARGVDYPGTTRVIQIGIPSSKDQYIHRIGRTGRAGKSGRADIILQPWEAGFLTWQLNDLPVKPLTVSELERELGELVERFDTDLDAQIPPEVLKAMLEGTPKGLSDRERKRSRGPRGAEAPPSAPSKIITPLAPRLSSEPLGVSIKDALAGLDEVGVRETFASLLGFYLGRTPELRTSKGSLLEGLKRWAVEDAGLEREPYVSDSFLQKLGVRPEGRGGGGGGGRFSDRGRGGGGGGGYGDRPRGGPGRFASERGGDRREGEFGERGEGRYRERSEGGFRERSEGGFRERREWPAFREREQRFGGAGAPGQRGYFTASASAAKMLARARAGAARAAGAREL